MEWQGMLSARWGENPGFEWVEIPPDCGMEDFARRQLERDWQWIGVIGGDGTVEAVARALLGQPRPLVIFPAGTYNNFAKSLGIPTEPEEAVEHLANARVQQVDVGVVNDRPFFECVGVGLDAAIYPEGEAIKSGNLWRWFRLFRKAYQFERAKVWVTLDRPVKEAVTPDTDRRLVERLRIHDTATFRAKVLMLTVSNGALYGANFTIAPNQTLTNGQFTLSVFSHYSKPELWWHFWSIAFGKRRVQPKTITLTARELTIRAPEAWPVHLDGDPVELWPLEIRCRSGALPVVH